MLRSSVPGRPGRTARTRLTVNPRLLAKFTQWMPPSKSAPPPASTGSSRHPAVRCRFTATRWTNSGSPIVPAASTFRMWPSSGL